MKIRNIIYLIVAIALSACSADDEVVLSPQQLSLIGQRVDFTTSMACPFVTRATYQHNGSFNEDDQMRIFRQYATDKTGTSFDATTEAFRTYYLKMDYATGISVSLNSDWRPKAGKLKSDAPGSVAVEQTAADTLTWENGKTVRFRAWGRSNLANALNSGTKESYYPDYMVSDWVTVSGPTQDIPLTLRHIACRIGITAKSGNELASVSLCTELKDYKRQDNADTNEHDEAETSKTDEDAQKELDAVMAAYNKMCMPAGVDDETFLLTAMTQERYNATKDFSDFEKSTDGIVKIGKMTATEIASSVQHPVFNSNDGRQYFMAIPIDMSKESAGKELVLPACTRFRVSLRGDSGYHIFVLSDIKDGSGEPLFKDGLTLKAGYSYLFSVGCHYDKFTITAADNFNWIEENLDGHDANNEAQTKESLDFGWWTGAYVTAANAALGGDDFIPEFSIKNQKEFMTFIHLVNGTAAKKMSGLTRGEVRKDENGKVIKDADGFETYWWKVDGEEDQITKEEAEALGYVFYPHYYPTVSTQAAHVIEDYVTGPMDFYDTDFGNRYVVKLTQDIDLYDWELPSIGTVTDKPFRGFFNGNGKTLSNLNMKSGYLFDTVMDGAITNLRIKSVHNTCLLNSAKKSGTTGWGCYIAGISLLCPSAMNSIATSLDGTSYVAGCIHIGDAKGALVGTANNLTMLGCMQVASGITSGTGALVGNNSVKFGDFMYNYYDVELSPGTNAVGTTADVYDYDRYIRGSKSHILKAKNDYMIGDDVDMKKLSENMKKEMYGLAPWKAMNQGIEMYNSSTIGTKYPCKMIYQTSTTGYTNQYPTLVYKK